MAITQDQYANWGINPNGNMISGEDGLQRDDSYFYDQVKMKLAQAGIDPSSFGGWNPSDVIGSAIGGSNTLYRPMGSELTADSLNWMSPEQVQQILSQSIQKNGQTYLPAAVAEQIRQTSPYKMGNQSGDGFGGLVNNFISPFMDNGGGVLASMGGALGAIGSVGGFSGLGELAGGFGGGAGGGAGGAAGGLSAETASWLASAGYTPEQIAAIGSQFGADGALAGITGTGLDAMGADWYSKMTPADLGLDANPFTTNPSFADLGGTAGTASGSSILDSIKNLFTPNAGTAASALSRLLNGNASTEDYLSLAGKLGLGALSAYGTNSQANALKDTANQYQAMGAPYRQRLADLYANPSGFLSSPEVQVPVQQGTDMLARSLSIKGNPAGSGNALQQLQSYSSDQLFSKLGQEKDRLAGFGGLSSYNAAAPATQNAAINANGQTMTNLGGTLNDVFNPVKNTQQQLADFMKLLK